MVTHPKEVHKDQKCSFAVIICFGWVPAYAVTNVAYQVHISFFIPSLSLLQAFFR